jgi:hypothetical protein
MNTGYPNKIFCRLSESLHENAESSLKQLLYFPTCELHFIFPYATQYINSFAQLQKKTNTGVWKNEKINAPYIPIYLWLVELFSFYDFIGRQL